MVEGVIEYLEVPSNNVKLVAIKLKRYLMVATSPDNEDSIKKERIHYLGLTHDAKGATNPIYALLMGHQALLLAIASVDSKPNLI